MKARKRKPQPDEPICKGASGRLNWPNGEQEQVEFVRLSTSRVGYVYVKREQQRNQLEKAGPLILVPNQWLDWGAEKK